MTKKVNSSLRANGGETHTLKIRIRIWKKKSFICLWLSSLLSVVFQWVLRNQAYIFWAPLVYVWGINSFYGWSLVSPWAYVDGVHLVWCKGILGFLTHLHRFLFFFFPEEVQKEEWAAVAKSHGGLRLNSPERCHYWTASGKATLRKAAVRTPRVRSWTLTQTAISKEERRRLRLPPVVVAQA